MTIYKEAGIFWSRTPENGYTQFTYDLRHIPTNKTFSRMIWILQANRADELFKYWDAADLWAIENVKQGKLSIPQKEYLHEITSRTHDQKRRHT